jgi:hypothetical protein
MVVLGCHSFLWFRKAPILLFCVNLHQLLSAFGNIPHADGYPFSAT